MQSIKVKTKLPLPPDYRELETSEFILESDLQCRPREFDGWKPTDLHGKHYCHCWGVVIIRSTK